MLIMEMNNLKKYYGTRLILNINHLKVYSEDRIGIIGLNGAGKSTLLELIEGSIKPDEGAVRLLGTCSYIPQGDVLDIKCSNKSGGEKAKLKIEGAFNRQPELMLADEPTANLDIEGVENLKERLNSFKGAILLVSHDRELLDFCCSSILEISSGEIKLYKGNYSSFLVQKSAEQERLEFQYNQYIKEKNKLLRAAEKLESKSTSTRKAPKRMGNSEARLHKMGDQKAKAALDRSKKAVESRLERLEVKNRPSNIDKIKLDIVNMDILHSKIAVEGVNISKTLGVRHLLENADFKIFNNTRTAIIGDNGCGKTTLIKMILSGDEGIKTSPAAKIGYFAQDFSVLDDNKSIISNVMETSIKDENFVRTVLSRLLFKNEEVYKKVSALSGGEKIKAALSKVLVSDYNLLILDEPTNYLDVYSLEAMEKVLLDYKGTLIFVSHDTRFVNKLAENIILFKDKKLICYGGNLDQYNESMKGCDQSRLLEQLMVTENRLSQIIGRVSMPGKGDDVNELNKQYEIELKELKRLKSLIKK